MARFSVAGRTSAIPTTQYGPSLYSTTAVNPGVLEVGIFNTTANPVAVGLARVTTTGTQGAGLTEVAVDMPASGAVATGFNTHTAGTVTATGLVRQASLGGAIGAGVIFTFADPGYKLDNATTSGLVIVCPTGTSQHLDFYIEWRE